jgi:hypothetical protein
MFEHIAILTVLKAWGISVVPAVLVQAFIIAGPFHKYQQLTPQTWRTGERSAYLPALVINAVACLLFALLFAFVADRMGGSMPGSWHAGLIFGALVWAAARWPRIMSFGFFANMHRGFIVGVLLADLSWSLVCGAVCGAVIRA